MSKKKKIKLGDKVLMPVTGTSTQKAKQGQLRSGTVVYVHPLYRFFEVEFVREHYAVTNVIRECYPIDLSQTRLQRKLRSLIAENRDHWKLN